MICQIPNNRLKYFPMTKPQTLLIILDGWGYREETKDNAVASAKTPNFNKVNELFVLLSL